MSGLQVTKAPIDFGVGLADSQEALGGAPQQVVNILKDATGFLRLAPGTSTWSWFPTVIPRASEVIGMTDFDGKLVYVTADRYIWVVEASGLVTALSDATVATQLDGNLPPSFAATKARLFIAGGGRMQYWPASGLTARVTDGPIASHVIANAQRVVASSFDNSGQFTWTEPGEGLHLSAAGWDPLNFAEAEARPDPVLAIFENSDEVFLFGKKTLQIFSPDPNTGYAPQYTMNCGLGPRSSVINMLERRMFAWITDELEAVISTGRDAEPVYISRPDITQTLKALGTVDDCRGEYLKIGNWRLLVWTFPTSGTTLAYDVDGKRWLRLQGYDSTIGDYGPWPVTSLYYWTDQRVVLAGLATGEIAVLDLDATTIAGEIIKGESLLGYDSAGTEGPKQTLTLRIPIRRGVGAFGTTTPPVIEISWRDKPGEFSRPLRISLGAAEQNRPQIVRRIVTRPYVRRQWRLQMAAGVNVAIGPIEATTEALED